MKLIFLVILSLFSFNAFAENLSGNFELKDSKIDYLVKYLIKKADGTSTTARGKGECKDKVCEFLIAAPIKSFTSKDGNRDLNMLKVTKADKFPLVVARVKAKSEISNNEIVADLEIDFVGIKKNYSGVVFKYSKTNEGFKVNGAIDLMLDNHQVEKPSLLGVDIENIVPITIEANFLKK